MKGSPTSKALAAGILAAGVAAIAIPAWADSGGGSDHRDRGRTISPAAIAFGAGSAKGGGRPMPLPPPPVGLSGTERKRIAKSSECMREHAADIPGVQTSKHGIFIPHRVDRSAVRKAAKACGAPLPPPPGKLLPPKFGQPPRGELGRRAIRCFGARGHAASPAK
jgi:hypothetical protein